MAFQGMKPYARMESTDTNMEDSALVAGEDRAAPPARSEGAGERLLRDWGRRPGLVALALAVAAVAALCCWAAVRGPQLYFSTERGLIEKSGSESRPGAAKGLRGAPASADGNSKVQSLERSNMPGAVVMEDTKAASLQGSDFPGAGDKKEQSLSRSDMPGIRAEAAAAVPARPSSREAIAVLLPPSKRAASKQKKETEDAEGASHSRSDENVFM